VALPQTRGKIGDNLPKGGLPVPKKEQYCKAIAEKYGLIVNFKGAPHSTRVPSPLDEGDDETFSQWTKRVLGDDVTDVSVWVPRKYGGSKRMRNVQSDAAFVHVKLLFHSVRRMETRKRRMAAEAAVEEVQRKLEGVPKDTLEDLLAELEGDLQPSVREFFDRFLDAAEEDIATEDLLRSLIGQYNELVKLHLRSNRGETV
jgi:hypothetical protein